MRSTPMGASTFSFKSGHQLRVEAKIKVKELLPLIMYLCALSPCS